MQGEWRFYVNGTWRSSPNRKPVINPYTGASIGTIAQASRDDIAEAIASASSAFTKTRALEAYERSEILTEISAGLRRRMSDLAALMTEESGKPIRFSRAEIDRAILTFTTAAEEAKRLAGEFLPLDFAAHSSRRQGILRRFPIGVIGAITPFNFPVNLVAHKVAPCIASGNTMVLKPASATSAVASAFTGIVAETKLPAGAFNLVTCSGKEAEILATDPRIAMLTFTGSPAVGWHLKQLAWKKRVTLELGGNAGVIVDDGVDPDGIVERIAQGGYGNSGQSCIAVQRIFVHKNIFNRFLEKFIAVSKTIAVGDPAREDTVVGTMIDESAAAKTEEWLKEAVATGARIVIGGGRNGAVFQPTILTGTTNAMKIEGLEVFAPVVTLTSVNSFDEAVGKINDSAYGLQAGVFTNNLEHAFTAYETLDVGGVVINDYPTYRVDPMPYGGVKESGIGREGIKYAIEEMTEPRLMVMNFSKRF